MSSTVVVLVGGERGDEMGVFDQVPVWFSRGPGGFRVPTGYLSSARSLMRGLGALVDLSIVVPCFNEEGSLGKLRDALVAVLPDVSESFEVILVDDGSSDETLTEIRRICAESEHFRFIALSRNFGKEAALLAGLRHAKGRRVGILDADLQHPPQLLEKMIPLLDSGYDQVVARRGRQGDPVIRSALSRLYYRAVNKLIDVPLQDGVGDFRILSRRAVDVLLSMPESNRFSKGLFAWIGFDTATVSYRNVLRASGESRWSFGKLVNYGIDGVVSFNNKPLRIAIYLGAAITLIAFCYAAFVVVDTLVDGVGVPGYATLMVSIAGLGGINLLFLGVLGEYLGRIYSESKRRPPYVVKEVGGYDNGVHSLRSPVVLEQWQGGVSGAIAHDSGIGEAS